MIQEQIETSSSALANSFMDNQNSKNKELSFDNYLSRMHSRTTPYGLLASVGVGLFSETNSSTHCEYKKIARVDLEFLNKIVKDTELKLWDELYLQWNGSTFEMGPKYINSWLSSLSENAETENLDTYSLVNNTNAVKLTKEITKTPIKVSNIIDKLEQEYPDISKEVINNFLKVLYNKEFLISELRPSLIQKDPFIYFLKQLQKYKDIDILPQLNQILSNLSQYNKSSLGDGIEYYRNAIAIMKGLHSDVNNYVRIDLFDDSLTMLNRNIKKDVNEFVEFITNNSDSNVSPILEEWCQIYIERYYHTEQLLSDVIDDIDGIGLPNTDLGGHVYNNANESFEQELMDNIINAASNKQNYIDIQNFKSLNEKKVQVHNNIEISFFVENCNNKNKLTLSPMIGNDNMGSTLGRFTYYLGNDLLHSTKNNYEEVELIFYPNIPRIGNIVNVTLNKKYIFEIGHNDLEIPLENKIQLEDIIINVTNTGVYFKHKKTNERLLFSVGHVTRVDLYPKLFQFLIACSNFKRTNTFSLISKIKNIVERNIYTPEIVFKNITIMPTTWKLNNLNYNDETIFIEELNVHKINYNIDNIIFLQEFDNRILINLDLPAHQKLLFRSYKKNRNILLVKNTLLSGIKNTKTEGLLSEYTFYLTNQNFSNEKNEIENYNKFIDSHNVTMLPFDNYLTLKIYTHNFLEDYIG